MALGRPPEASDLTSMPFCVVGSPSVDVLRFKGALRTGWTVSVNLGEESFYCGKGDDTVF